MRRDPQPGLVIGDVIDVVAHEFGHSFALDDEYEDFDGDGPDGSGDEADNTVSISSINLDSNLRDSRFIDKDKIKSFNIKESDFADVIQMDALIIGVQVRVLINISNMSLWQQAKDNNLSASLWRVEYTVIGKQLPLGIKYDLCLRPLQITDVNTLDNGDITYCEVVLYRARFRLRYLLSPKEACCTYLKEIHQTK